MSGVFEIREYIDDNGNTKNNEIVDITKELEHFAKLGGDAMEAQAALDEEKQFIRELALMAEKSEETRQLLKAKKAAGADDNIESPAQLTEAKVDDLDVVFDRLYEESIAKQRVTSTAKPTNTTKNTKTSNKQTSATTTGSGWKSGFLSSSNAKKEKKRTDISSASTVSSSSAQSSVNIESTQPVTTEPPTTIKKVDIVDKSIPIEEPKNVKKVIFDQNIVETTTNNKNNISKSSETEGSANVTEDPVKANVFSQTKHIYQKHNTTGGLSTMKPLPKVPKGETSSVAFTGNILERR